MAFKSWACDERSISLAYHSGRFVCTKGLAILIPGILTILWQVATSLPDQTPAAAPKTALAEPQAETTEPQAETTGPRLDLIEAVRLTFENDPNIAIVEARLEASHGALRFARGTFDPVLSSSVTESESRTPVDETSSSDSSTLSQSVSLQQLLRSGLSLEPSVDLQRSDDAGPAINTATVSFTVRQPLLRDRGHTVVGAEELASERELEAAKLDLEHAVALRLVAVASQYWRARAAVLDLDVLRATETSSRELLANTRRLVAADVTPAAEIVQLEADLASREVSRIAGEQALFGSRQDLGREVGLEAARIRALPLPGDPFPSVNRETLPETDDAFLAEALARRADLAAARQRLAAGELRLKAADNALKPRLDLIVTPSYSGLVEGSGAETFYTPLLDNVPGVSTTLGFTFSWPTLNRRAEGALIQAEASVRQDGLQVELASKSIGAEVPTALDAVRRSADQLVRLDRAVALFEQALANEIKKLSAGSSTVVDVITQRDRLTSAQQRRVAAQLALALALVDLRFETGTLYLPGTDARTIRRENLTTLPF